MRVCEEYYNLKIVYILPLISSLRGHMVTAVAVTV